MDERSRDKKERGELGEHSKETDGRRRIRGEDQRRNSKVQAIAQDVSSNRSSV
ncbi:unnamed protein product [Anisakis simplex]|uniref:YpzI family protein n=1 Tax=Anisakis simplex TaxID=6269 RepID=A0A0M3KD05_ANISI|nr:unnamed protein product [Anisakis simplex]